MSFDPGKPVQTRDGRKARIIATDAKDGARPRGFIVALVEDRDSGGEEVFRYFSNGSYLGSFGNPLDLVNIPEEISNTWGAAALERRRKARRDLNDALLRGLLVTNLNAARGLADEIYGAIDTLTRAHGEPE